MVLIGTPTAPPMGPSGWRVEVPTGKRYHPHVICRELTVYLPACSVYDKNIKWYVFVVIE